MSELIGVREAARRLGVSDTAVHKAIKKGRVTVAGHTETSGRPLLAWPQVAEDWVGNSDPTKRSHVGPQTRRAPPPVVALGVSGEGGAPPPVVAQVKAKPAPKKKKATESGGPIPPTAGPIAFGDGSPEAFIPAPTAPVEEHLEAQPHGGALKRSHNPENHETDGDVPVTYADYRKQREKYQAEMARLDFEEKSKTLIPADEVRREAFRLARVTRDSMLNIPDRLAAELAAETNQFKIHRRLTEEIRLALSDLGGEA